MIPLEAAAELERLIGSLSGEIALIEVGKDEGLVPAYTLLSELQEVLEPDKAAHSHCQGVQEKLGDLLDKGGIFDQETSALMLFYAEQLQCLLRYYRMGEQISWDQLESQWVANESGSGVAPPPEQVKPKEAPKKPDKATPDADLEQFNSLMFLDLDESREVLVEFHQEAIEHLDNIEAALLELEDDPKNQDAMSSVFRSFHTIKGVAGFLDLTPIRVLAHEVETLLDLIRSDKMDLDESVVSLVLESRDRLQSLMDQVEEGLANGTQPDQVIPVSDLIGRTHTLMSRASDDIAEPAPAAAPSVTETMDFDRADTDAEKAVSEAEQQQKAAKADAARKRAADRPAATIRMNTEKLDGIIDAVGELVIVESQLRDSILSSNMTSARIERNLAQLGRITSELQRSGLSLRMVSMKQLFQKMQRLARDLTNKSGKKAIFRVEGEETEMDRTVVEKIGDPLVHMIRNSLDHGIEMPEERIGNNKNEVGNVTLKAYYQGDNIVLDLRDDGKGVNSDKVLKKAIERGVASKDKSYTQEEIINFLFMPGFSTAEKVSDISGRGVGMDVVRSNVAKLRGRIEMTSVQGKGSQVRIFLPLTMAIIDGLLIRVGEERYILPLINVNMTLKPVVEQVFTMQSKGKVIKHREEIFPLVHLGEFFEIKGDASEPHEGVVVMIDTDRHRFGLIVDEILHKQEVVVKNLGATSHHPKGVSGGAILGDGTISLILDPPGLVATGR